jgi:hypothetical protein
MSEKNRSLVLMSLISASLLVSVFTIVQAQSPAPPVSDWMELISYVLVCAVCFKVPLDIWLLSPELNKP